MPLRALLPFVAVASAWAPGLSMLDGGAAPLASPFPGTGTTPTPSPLPSETRETYLVLEWTAAHETGARRADDRLVALSYPRGRLQAQVLALAIETHTLLQMLALLVAFMGLLHVGVLLRGPPPTPQSSALEHGGAVAAK